MAEHVVADRAGTWITLDDATILDTARADPVGWDHNAACNLAALAAADTGESRRELLDGSGVRPVVLARPAVASPREESIKTQRHHREAVAR